LTGEARRTSGDCLMMVAFRGADHTPVANTVHCPGPGQRHRWLDVGQKRKMGP
jgi:hypothetical protein